MLYQKAWVMFNWYLKDTTVRRDYTLGLIINIILMIFSLYIGFQFGSKENVKIPLGKIKEKTIAFQAQAARHTVHVINNNVKVGMNLTFLSALPLYGPVITNWKLGSSFAILSKSLVNGINYHSFILIMLLLPHGIPEYAGFILMENSVTTLQFSFAGFLCGRNRQWKPILHCSIVSFIIGLIILSVAAVVECYITPTIARILVNQ